MGYLTGGACHADIPTATSVMCATAFPYETVYITNNNANLYVYECTSYTQQGVMTIRRTQNGQSPSTFTLQPSFANCDVMDYPNSAWDMSMNDGLLVGGAIVSALLVGAGFKFLNRVL